MNTGLRVLAVVLFVGGLIVLAVGGVFTFTETHDVGPFAIRETEGVNVPIWAGLGAMAIGIGIFLVTLMPRTARHA